MSVLAARFVARYGMAALHNPSAYPTTDGFIPWRLFLSWMSADAGLSAADQLRQASAVQLGAATVMAGDKPSVKAAWRKLTKAAGG